MITFNVGTISLRNSYVFEGYCIFLDCKITQDTTSLLNYRLLLQCNCSLSSTIVLRCLLLTLIALVSHQVRRTIRWQMSDLVLRSHKSTTGSVGFRMLHDETYTSLDGKITQDTASLLNYLKGNYSTSSSVERHSFQ